MTTNNELQSKTMCFVEFPSIPKREKDFDEMSISSDVSYELVERSTCQQRFKKFLLHLFCATIVIGAMAGALFWSITQGETAPSKKKHGDEPKNFTININEYTKYNGTYSILYNTSGDNKKNTEPVSYPSWWYQDYTNQRLVHRKDNQTTVYAFSRYTYIINYDKNNEYKNCSFDFNMNYATYIKRLGLTNLIAKHSQYVTSPKNGTTVYVYNGNPTDVMIDSIPQDAFLVTVYSNETTGALLGWDTYFNPSNTSNFYEISYEYNFMTTLPTSPPDTIFQVPVECQPFAQNEH